MQPKELENPSFNKNFVCSVIKNYMHVEGKRLMILKKYTYGRRQSDFQEIHIGSTIVRCNGLTNDK